MRPSPLLLALVLLVAGAGCAKPPPPVDPAPFAAAITGYLAAQQFGMKIAKVERIDLAPAGDTATVTCKLQEAEGTYGLAVTWEFDLRRAADQWQVTTHRTK